MAKPRFALKRDSNHSEIQAHLEAHGIECVDTSKAGVLPDLLVLARGSYAGSKDMNIGRAGWIELKVLKGAKYTYPQLYFIAHTSFPVCIASDKDAALAFARHGEGYLPQSAKDRLAGALLKIVDKKKLHTPNQVQVMLYGEQ